MAKRVSKTRSKTKKQKVSNRSNHYKSKRTSRKVSRKPSKVSRKPSKVSRKSRKVSRKSRKVSRKRKNVKKISGGTPPEIIDLKSSIINCEDYTDNGEEECNIFNACVWRNNKCQNKENK